MDDVPRRAVASEDLKAVETLRARMKAAAVAGQVDEGRRLEEAAMAHLGYKKVWLRCGRGTFMWLKRAPHRPAEVRP